MPPSSCATLNLNPCSLDMCHSTCTGPGLFDVLYVGKSSLWSVNTSNFVPYRYSLFAILPNAPLVVLCNNLLRIPVPGKVVAPLLCIYVYPSYRCVFNSIKKIPILFQQLLHFSVNLLLCFSPWYYPHFLRCFFFKWCDSTNFGLFSFHHSGGILLFLTRHHPLWPMMIPFSLR